MALRGLIDREGAARFFKYPLPASVRAGQLRGSWWPTDPWTGARMTHPGVGRGRYVYSVRTDRRHHYRLTGYLGTNEAAP